MLPFVSRLLDKLTFGSARRRRSMARLLAELDKMPADALPTGPGRSSYRPPRQSRLPGLRAIVTLLVWVFIIGGVVYLARLGNHKSSSASPQPSPSASASGQAFGQDASHSNQKLPVGGGSYPTPGKGELAARPLPAPPIPAGTGGYKFLEMNKSSPVSYDPCRPIHYVIREHETPTGGDPIITKAVAAVSKATGLRFIDDGATTELPTNDRAAYQPLRYGDRWAPVLIAWTDAQETPALAGDVVGFGGSQSYWFGDPDNRQNSVYLSGTVALDAPDFTKAAGTPGGPGVELAIVEHELGHLVGLAHVNDRTQIMNPVTTAVTCADSPSSVEAAATPSSEPTESRALPGQHPVDAAAQQDQPADDGQDDQHQQNRTQRRNDPLQSGVERVPGLTQRLPEPVVGMLLHRDGRRRGLLDDAHRERREVGAVREHLLLPLKLLELGLRGLQGLLDS
jgi:hypothetical protein